MVKQKSSMQGLLIDAVKEIQQQEAFQNAVEPPRVLQEGLPKPTVKGLLVDAVSEMQKRQTKLPSAFSEEPAMINFQPPAPVEATKKPTAKDVKEARQEMIRLWNEKKAFDALKGEDTDVPPPSIPDHLRAKMSNRKSSKLWRCGK